MGYSLNGENTMNYSKAPTIHIVDKDNIFINGDHINDIAERNEVVIHITNTHNSPYYNIRFMKPHGVLHTVDNPAMVTAVAHDGGHIVVRTSYNDYGMLHNVHGPSEVTYDHEGKATDVYYAMNHKRINHSKYLKDQYNPTIEEMFIMKLGEG